MFLLTLIIAGCGSSDEEEASIASYGGSMPVGDFIVVQIDRSSSLVRHINYTTDEDSGWLSYTAVSPSDDKARGFSILNRVEIDGGNYVLFAEFPNTAVVYQVFDSSDNSVDWPVYVVYREEVDKSTYYEKAYNWMKFTIDETVSDDSAMEAGFAAFDSTSAEGLLYGAGYNSEDDSINDINAADQSKVDSFTANTELVANTMWTGTVGDMNTAITLTGTASGANILDFGPDTGGGSGIAIPQSNVTLSTAAGTYFLLVYDNNKASDTVTVTPMKLVISATSPHIKVFEYTENTESGTTTFSDDLTAIENLDASESPGTDPIKDDFSSTSGNSSASSTIVQNAHLCKGSFVAVETDQVLNIMFDSTGSFCGFTMFDTTGDDIIRFGFGIKDSGYTNQ
jgi:hypothetical protein